MTEINNSISRAVAKSFEKALNRHGYGFHYSVLREAMNLAEQRKSAWAFSIIEFPVEVQGYGTRIDFILQNVWKSLYMVAECKRANPSLAYWCFAKVPDYLIPVSHQHIFVDIVTNPKESLLRSGIAHLFHFTDIYDVALEVKTGEKGDSTGGGRGAIEEAATQVCRGLNGLIETLKSNPTVLGNELLDKPHAGFLPVIFTTARLWVSNVDLSSADLEDGRFDLDSVNVEEKKWLFYRYHQSPGLKHSVPTTTNSKSLRDMLYKEYVRTIAVVSASGIEEFLSWRAWRY